MKTKFLEEALQSISHKENQLRLKSLSKLEESLELRNFIYQVYINVRNFILETPFESASEEINFFKETKPKILSRLMYYNNVYRLETTCPPATGSLHKKHFEDALYKVEQEFQQYTMWNEFYHYYRSGRTDMDHEYFRVGKNSESMIFNSVEFEIDPRFTTRYDYKLARIMAYSKLLPYLHERINQETIVRESIEADSWRGMLVWTASKSDLIEHIYGMKASGAICNGNIEILTLAKFYEWLYGLDLSDIHHTFHRMKTREKTKTIFHDHQIKSLIAYMNKDL